MFLKYFSHLYRMRYILQILLSFTLVFFILLPFQQAEENLSIPTKKMFLHKDWTFTEQGKHNWKPAKVPGVVHTDLLENKMIPDPWYGTNEKKIQWVENKNWVYQSTFSLTENQINFSEINLVFEGLDTYATIFVNGKKIGEANNMFLAWQWKVKKRLKVGQNTLKVVFYSPIEKLRTQVENAKFTLPASSESVDFRVSPYVRKAPYHFGWDWGPRYVTCGVWRPVYLEFVEFAKIKDVQVYQQRMAEKSAEIAVKMQFHIAKKGNYEIVIGGKVKSLFLPIGDTELTVSLRINNPKWWWPNGWGKPNMYAIETSIRKNNAMVDEESVGIGLRTIELVQEEDQLGESFYFKVNGKKIFAKGANYIPQSNFLPSVSQSQYDALIHDVKAANMNMLRVWGGGIYENDYFYELCDKNGILIWQDFMFANTMYPVDSAFLNNVKREAIYNVLRLRNHPSLAYWNGNNEIKVAWKGWGWQKKYAYSKQDSTEIFNGYVKLFDTILRSVVKKYDSKRQYNSTSPQDSYYKLRYTKKGDVHYWGVWHGSHEFIDFRNYIGRFVSEYGFQSFPNMETIKTFSVAKDWSIESEVMKWHQKSPVGNEMIAKQAKQYFSKAKNFKTFVVNSQKVQALAMQTAINAHRLAKDYCGGTLYWQLNDCWPGPSWSGRDVYGNWKILHKRLPTLFSNLTVIPLLEDKTLEFYAINDLFNTENVMIQLEYFNSYDELLWKKQFKMQLKTDKAYKIYTELDANKINLIRQKKAYFIAKIYKLDKDKTNPVAIRKIDRWDVLY